MTIDQWVDSQFTRATANGVITEQELSQRWIIAYAESIAQLRPHTAPIDEPCFQWLSSLHEILKDN